MTKVKFCGLKRSEDIEYTNGLLPDYAGFVFAAGTRQITFAKARQLRAQLDPRVQSVGVFVQAELDFIRQLADAGTIDLVQLHGDESPAYCRALRKKVKLPIIKALRIRTAESLPNAEAFDCDYLLLDAYTEGVYGGSGKSFAWELLRRRPLRKPYFIAGGLNEHNVDTVLAFKPYGVDVSGGIETKGLKDFEKMRDFIAGVKGCNEND